MSKSEAGKQAGEVALRRAVERFEQRPAFAVPKIAPAPVGRSNLFRQFVAQHNPGSLTNRWWVHAYSPLLSTQILDRQIAHRYSRLDRSPGYLQLILRLRRKPLLPQLEPEAESDSIVERSQPSISNYERVPEYYSQFDNQSYQSLPDTLQRSEADFSLPVQPSRFEPERFLPPRLSTPDHSLKPNTADFKPPVLRSLAAITDRPVTTVPATPPFAPSLAGAGESPLPGPPSEFTPDSGPLSLATSDAEQNIDTADVARTILPESVSTEVTPSPGQAQPAISSDVSASISVRPSPLVSPGLRLATTPTALMRAFERLDNVTPPVAGETGIAASIMQMPLALSRPAMEASTPPDPATSPSATVRRSLPQPQAELASGLRTQSPQPQTIQTASPQMSPKTETAPVRPEAEFGSPPEVPAVARVFEQPETPTIARASEPLEVSRFEPVPPANPGRSVSPISRLSISESISTPASGVSSGNASQLSAPVSPRTNRAEEMVGSSGSSASPELVAPTEFAVETTRSGLESAPARLVEIEQEQGEASNALARALERTVKPVQPPNFLPGNFLSRSILSPETGLFSGQAYQESISQESAYPDVPEMNYARLYRQPAPEVDQPAFPVSPDENARPVARSLDNEEIIRQQISQQPNILPQPNVPASPSVTSSSVSASNQVAPESQPRVAAGSTPAPDAVPGSRIAATPAPETVSRVEAGSTPVPGIVPKAETPSALAPETVSRADAGATPVTEVEREVTTGFGTVRSDSPNSGLIPASPFFLSSTELAFQPGVIARSIMPHWAARLPALVNNPGFAFDLQAELLQSSGTPAQFRAESVVARLVSGGFNNVPTTSAMALARVLQRTYNPLALAYSLGDPSSEVVSPANLNLVYRLPASPGLPSQTESINEAVEASRPGSESVLQRNTQGTQISPPAVVSPSFTTFVSGQPSGLLDTLGISRTPLNSGVYWPSSPVSQNLNPARPGVIARALRRIQNPLTSDFYLPVASFAAPNFEPGSSFEMAYALPQFTLGRTQAVQSGLNLPELSTPDSTVINRAILALPDVSSPMVQRQAQPISPLQPQSGSTSMPAQNSPALERSTAPDFRSLPENYPSSETLYPFGSEDFATAATSEIFVPQMPVLAGEWTANLPALSHHHVISRRLLPEQGLTSEGENFASPLAESFEISEAASPAMPLGRVLQRTQVPVGELNRVEAASMIYSLLRRSSGNVESIPEPLADFAATPLSNDYRTGVVTRQYREIPTSAVSSLISNDDELSLISTPAEISSPLTPPLARAMERRESATLPGIPFAGPGEVDRSYTVPPLVWRKVSDYTPPEVSGLEPVVTTPTEASTFIPGSPSTLARTVIQPVSPGSPNFFQPDEAIVAPGNTWTSNLPALRHNPGFLQPESETPLAPDFRVHIPDTGNINLARSPEMVLPNVPRSLTGLEAAPAIQTGILNPANPVLRTTSPQAQPSTEVSADRGLSQPPAALSPATAVPIHPSSFILHPSDHPSEAATVAEPVQPANPTLRRETEIDDGSFAEPVPMSHPAPWIQRKASASAPASNSVPAIGASLSPATILRTAIGKPLERKIQEQMGAIFRTRLEHVRVHTDEHAADYTRQMGAEALTIGPNILFAPGRYQPETPAGQALIGHELTHVVQQANLPSLGGGRIPETSPQGQALEHEAIHNEKILLRHLSNQQSSPSKLAGETSLGYVSPSSPNDIARSFSPVEQQHLHAEKFSPLPTPTSSVPQGIQREMEKSHEHRASAPPIQRALGDEGGSSDVQTIAQEVYRLIKLQLQIDRERSGSRGGSIF